MATPTAKTYSGPSGGSIGGGLSLGPAWALAIGIGQIKAIANTSGAGSASVDVFSGGAWKFDSYELWLLACGGHHDSYDNRVVSIDLSADVPGAVGTNGWIQRHAPSPFSAVQNDVAYYTDGLPSSRHVYHTAKYIPQRGTAGRLMLFGSYGAYADMGGNGAFDYMVLDGFDPVTNNWDPAGTWTYASNSLRDYGNAQEGEGGNVWAIWGNRGVHRYNAATGAWTDPVVTNQQSPALKYPWAYNGSAGSPSARYLFGLCYGDGSGSSLALGVQAIKMDNLSATTATQTLISFNASAALTQFQTEQPSDAGMDYCPVDGCFYFYNGKGSAAGRIYKITPNAGTTWDMSIVSPAAGSDTLPASSTGGILSRFVHITLPGGIKGFLIHPAASSNLYFMRTQ